MPGQEGTAQARLVAHTLISSFLNSAVVDALRDAEALHKGGERLSCQPAAYACICGFAAARSHAATSPRGHGVEGLRNNGETGSQWPYSKLLACQGSA